MRSSIACSRCRRSKVKCVNNGVGTQCRACETSGRDCEYPSSVAGPSRRRDSIPGRNDGSGDIERRPRHRKSAQAAWATGTPSGARESPRPLLDALDPKILTPNVWLELFEIYEMHYSADFSFLHVTTFKKPLNHARLMPQSFPGAGEASLSVRPPGSNEFLLAFLALTARFHPKLVAHHSPPTQGRPSNPLLASEYYAEAVNERLISYLLGQRNESVETVQAYIMLALHEWGMSRGWHAWQLVGHALRAAQALGLQYDTDLDDTSLSRTVPLDIDTSRAEDDVERRRGGLSSSEDSDLFLQQEIRRRTFWSCFMLDRFLSTGKFRPQTLHVREFRVQLPASERKFSFVDRVRTPMLGETDQDVENRRQSQLKIEPRTSPIRTMARLESRESQVELESGEREGVVSRYVKILELYGQVLNWVCAGGRKKEEFPPWDQRSRFFELREQLRIYKSTLPRDHTLSRNNLQAHIHSRSAPAYTLLHIVFLLCQVFLHREYIPFLPPVGSKPSGPLGEAKYSSDKTSPEPERFWEDITAECFAAARDIIDLLSTCSEYNHLVQTPIVVFAVYVVAFLGVYCINFPEMDPHGFLCTPLAERGQDGNSKLGQSPGYAAAINAAEMLHASEQRYRMAGAWYKTIMRLGKFYKKVQDVGARSARGQNGDVKTETADPAAKVTPGTHDEYKLFERSLTDMNHSELDDIEMLDAQLDNRDDDNSSQVTGDGPSEDGLRSGVASNAELARQEGGGNGGGSWSAINTPHSNHSAHNPSGSAPPNNGGFRSYESYHSPQQAHQPMPASQPLQQQSYGFRPAYSADGPNSTAPASILSPPSQPSPSYDRHGSLGGPNSSAWNSQGAAPGAMAPPDHHHPQSSAISNGHSNQLPPLNSHHSGLAQTQPSSLIQQSPRAPVNNAATQARNWPNTPEEVETFRKALPQHLSADDLAAFADGSDPAAFAFASGRMRGTRSSRTTSGAASSSSGMSWLSAIHMTPHDFMEVAVGSS